MISKTFLVLIEIVICADWNHFRLPEVAKPSHYEVELKPYLDPDDQGDQYDGTVFYFKIILIRIFYPYKTK